MSYTVLESGCHPYTVNTPVTISSSEYGSTLNPPPLSVFIEYLGGSESQPAYNINFGNGAGSFTGSFNFDVNFNITLRTTSFSALPSFVSAVGFVGDRHGVSGSVAPDDRLTANIVFINNASNYLPGSYDIGDAYAISLNSLLCNTGAQITFFRPNNAVVNTSSVMNTPVSENVNSVSNNRSNLTMNINGRVIGGVDSKVTKSIRNSRSSCFSCTGRTGCTGPAIIPNLVRIPDINILGQTTVNGEFLSDVTFFIDDKYQYYENTAKIACENKDNNGCCENCQPIYTDVRKLKRTKFFQYGPEMQCVVKGNGATLRDKLIYTYNRNIAVLGPSFQDFYDRMIVYGLLKYVLARVLYGDFNMKYLCRNFNKQFFKDLAHSRFCGFIEFFDDPANGVVGFDRWFKNCDNDCK